MTSIRAWAAGTVLLGLSACGPSAQAPSPPAATATSPPPVASSAAIAGVPFTCADLAGGIARLASANRLVGASIPEADQDFYSEYQTTFTPPGAGKCIAFEVEGGEFGYSCEWTQPSTEAANAAQQTFAAAIAGCYPGGADVPNTGAMARPNWSQRSVSADHPDWTIGAEAPGRTHDQSLADLSDSGGEGGDDAAKAAKPLTPVVVLRFSDAVTECEAIDGMVLGETVRLKELATKPSKPRRLAEPLFVGALDICDVSTETGGVITCGFYVKGGFAEFEASYGKCLGGWTRKVIPTENFIGGVELGQSVEYAGERAGAKMVVRVFEEKAPDPSRWWREVRLQ